MRLIGLLLAFASSSAIAAGFPVSQAYGTKDGCLTLRNDRVTAGIVLSPKMLITPEVGCHAIIKTATGYRVSCPGFEPSAITFVIYRQDDGTIAYADDYWGATILHRCH